MENIKLALGAIVNCAQEEKVKSATEKHFSGMLSAGFGGVCAPINVKFDFDYAELAKVSGVFLELLLFEPVQCLDGLREASHSYIQHFATGICNVQMQQIHCSIRFTGLPLDEDEFIFRPFVHPIRLGVTTMHCVVSGLGEHGSYVQQSIWYCPSKCTANDCHIIGRCPFDWTQNDDSPKCLGCTTELKEHTDYRKVIEYRLIKVHLAESVQTPHNLQGHIKRGVTVQLMEDSCAEKLYLGDEYVLVGNYNPMANRFIAWNISPY